jgi:hypothetical protein
VAIARLESVFQNGFATDAAWFEQTPGTAIRCTREYLQVALCFTREAYRRRPRSLKDGYYYGWSPFGRFVRLAATHGNAMQSSSNAFLMSTHRQFPAFVRADNAKALLRD